MDAIELLRQNEQKDESLEADMKFTQKAIVEIRTLRAENRIPPKEKTDLRIKVSSNVKVKGKVEILTNPQNKIYIQTLANVQRIETFKGGFPKRKNLLMGIVSDVEMALPLEKGLINFNQERKRLERELSKIGSEIDRIEKRLKNSNFLTRAPKEVIQETKRRLGEFRNKKTMLEESLKHILSLI